MTTEENRLAGRCPFCGSGSVWSFGAAEWRCEACTREWNGSANTARKRRAALMLALYAEDTEQLREDETSLLGDLLADCMHLIGPEAVETCMNTGRDHYEAETGGEE